MWVLLYKKLSIGIPQVFLVFHNEDIGWIFPLGIYEFECYRVRLFLPINCYRFDKK